MADKITKPQVSNERSELLKGANPQNKINFVDPSNQMFARTQSTPIEDQKKLQASAGSLKSRLKLVKGGGEFVPGGQSTHLAQTFLSPGQPSSATSNVSNTYVQNKPNGPEAVGPSTFVPSTTATTSTSKPFVPAESKAPTTTEVSDKSIPSFTPNKAGETVPTPPGSNNNLDAEAKKNSLKSKLKLSSASFSTPAFNPMGGSAPADSSKPFTPQTNVPVVGADKNQAPIGEWGKTLAKTDEKVVPKQASPSKISLQSGKYDNNKVAPPQKNQGLEPILESKSENKEAAAKVEETKPVPENKKPEPVKEVKSPVKTEFTEVKPKHKYGARTTETKTTVGATTTPAQKTEVKKPEEPVKVPEVKKVEEPKKATATPVKTEVKAPEVKETVKPVAEVKKEEPVKPVEEVKPAKAEIKEEIVSLSRVKFEEMIEDLKDRLKNKKLPEALQIVKDRIISAESSRQKQPYGGKGGKDQQKTFDRERERPQPAAEVQRQQQEGGFGRSDKTRSELPIEQQKSSGIVRIGLTEEEKKKKEELHTNVNQWIQNMKGQVDPEEAIKKKIKFNLNIITADNFDPIKEEILNIAADKVENCKRVAEFLIENAWTQKQYVNIYAKLCDFMGRSERLYFDDIKADSKKKNSFKLHIMKQIQTVFEDDVNINLGFKKPFEELNDEEKVLYFAKKKQRILGNVSFIGELFLEKFLVIGLMRIITKSLLQKFVDEYGVYTRTEGVLFPRR